MRAMQELKRWQKNTCWLWIGISVRAISAASTVIYPPPLALVFLVVWGCGNLTSENPPKRMESKQWNQKALSRLAAEERTDSIYSASHLSRFDPPLLHHGLVRKGEEHADRNKLNQSFAVNIFLFQGGWCSGCAYLEESPLENCMCTEKNFVECNIWTIGNHTVMVGYISKIQICFV